MDVAAGLSQPHPFAQDVDPETFYPSGGWDFLWAALVAGANMHAGFLVLSGEAGTGKTAVLHRVTRDLEHAGVRVLRSSALRPPHEMFSPGGGETGTPGAGGTPTWGASFLTTLQARVRAEGATVVTVDDAERLTLTELRFFRDLTVSERATGRRLVVLLVGQPAFDIQLARLEDDRPDPAFALRVRLSPLDTADVRGYIAYRLQRAGLRLDEVFTADAV